MKRSFQPKRFERWLWLHYVEDCDLAFFCFTCVSAYKQKYLQACGLFEKAFVSSGFSNWKNATSKFCKARKQSLSCRCSTEACYPSCFDTGHELSIVLLLSSHSTLADVNPKHAIRYLSLSLQYALPYMA